MKERNIALIGFRATGKSAVGRLLAGRLNRTFIDMDEHLTANFGRDISCWVRLHGWDSFRDEESSLLRVLADGGNMVVSTGGGIILNPSNRRILQERFVVVWLTASSETIRRRLPADPRTACDRPPLTDLPFDQEIEHLLRERSPFYAECADFTLPTDESSLHDLVCSVLSFISHGSLHEGPR